jgi:uncharacterized protein YoxC
MDEKRKRNYTEQTMDENAEKNQRKNESPLEKMALATTQYIGSIHSLVLHSIFFVGIFALQWLGFSFDKIMLILTTAVSLEAIYLAIFIQMTVNHQAHKLAEVSEDVEDISEDVEDIQEDMEEISKDIDDIQEDVEDISEDVEKGDEKLALKHQHDQERIAHIEIILKELIQEVRGLKDKHT